MKTISPSIIHHGQNIKRLREMLGVKQEAIAVGLNITQQAMSKLEQKDEIDDETLEKVSQVLKVPADVIKNYNDEAAINVIANTFNEASFLACYQSNQPTFNPIDKIVELTDNITALYERLLKTEQEKNALLEKLADGKILE
jgi:transcriptional regulator with XRE-family HTH domain